MLKLEQIINFHKNCVAKAEQIKDQRFRTYDGQGVVAGVGRALTVRATLQRR